MYIILITILGYLLRIININKPEGLWNDEYVSWQIASTPFKDGFIHNIFSQCHMPLYYFYLKPFSGYSDTILRLTSVLPSLLAIVVMYFVGKEFSKKIGYFAAIITAILPFLVYYAQEVRFYSLLFLFSAILLLCYIKIKKNGNKQEWLAYIITSLLIIFTHNLGLIFIFLTTISLLFYKRIFNIKICLALILPIIALTPFAINILKMLPSSQWWSNFSYTNILFLFSDYFSPILTNNINAPRIFFYNQNFLFIFLITVPTLIATYSLLNVMKRCKDLSLIVISFLLILSILAINGCLVFITKYSIEALPILILMLSLGFDKLKKIGTYLFCIFVLIQLLSINTNYYPPKTFRTEGNAIPAMILNLHNPDKVIYTYYSPERFQRYLKISPYSAHISKINRFEYIDTPQKIFTGVNSGEKVSLVFLDSVSFIPNNYILQAYNNKTPEMFVTFSKIRNDLTNYMQQSCYNLKKETIGSWTILTGIKL